MAFIIVRNPNVSAAEKARSRRYSDSIIAIQDMGEGLVLETGTDRLVAFHEKHERLL